MLAFISLYVNIYVIFSISKMYNMKPPGCFSTSDYRSLGYNLSCHKIFQYRIEQKQVAKSTISHGIGISFLR